jgi:hypothetical protein
MTTDWQSTGDTKQKADCHSERSEEAQIILIPQKEQ